MNTKRIWMWSLVFGLAAALIAYVVFFVKEAEEADSMKESDTELVEENDKAAELPKREMANPMVPVSEGMRAISLKVAVEQGVSGYIEPNSLVDIIAYETKKDKIADKEFLSAVLVLQNVKVLSSGKSSDGKDESLQYETVTVEVSPKDGVMLSLASKDKNGFHFMLRNAEDENVLEKKVKITREIIKD